MADVNYKIGADATAVVKEIGKVRKTLAGMGRMNWQNIAMGVQAVMGNLATFKNAAVGAFNALVKPAAEVENFLLSFEVMFSSAEKAADHMGKLRKYASSTPFELSDIADASGVLLGFSVEAEKSHEVLRQLGDIAAVTGSGLKDLAMIYGKVKAIGLETETVNQLAERKVDVRAMLAARDGLSVADVQKRISAKKYGVADLDYVLQTLTGSGGKFHGGTARKAESIDGALSTLSDSLTDVAVVIGNVLSPAIKGFAQDLSAVLPKVQQWLENMGLVVNPGEMLTAQIDEPEVFKRMRAEVKQPRSTDVEEKVVDPKLAEKLTQQYTEQRRERAAARGDAAFGKLSAHGQAEQVQKGLAELGFRGSLNNTAAVEHFLNGVQKNAAFAGDEASFNRAAKLRERYNITRQTASSTTEARREAYTAAARQDIVEGGNAVQLARFDATQSAVAQAQQYIAAGMGQQEAARLAAAAAAANMQLPQAGGLSATVAQSRVAIGGGGTSLRMGDAQLDVSRRHLNIAEETKRVLDNVLATLTRSSGSSSGIPVVP